MYSKGRLTLWEPIIASDHSAKFCCYRHCGSGHIMFLVVDEEDSRCSCFNPLLLFITKGLQWLQFNMWSLADVDRVPLNCLSVLGDTPSCSETRIFIYL